MITNLLGKILFPRHQPWQRERQARVFMATMFVALVLAGVVGWVIYWRNYSGRF
jgi:polyferredoxin